MANNRFFPSILLLLVFLLQACPGGKSAPTPADPLAEKKKIIQRVWRVAKVSQTGQQTPLYQNPLPSGQAITEDYGRYRLAFTSETAYAITGRVGSTTAGSWEFNTNGTTVLLDKGVSGKEATIQVTELSAASLKITVTETSAKTGSRELQLDLIPQ